MNFHRRSEVSLQLLLIETAITRRKELSRSTNDVHSAILHSLQFTLVMWNVSTFFTCQVFEDIIIQGRNKFTELALFSREF